MSQAHRLATAVGLSVALGGAVLPVGGLLGNADGLGARVLEQGFLWLLFGLVIAVVVLWERQPLTSIGVRWRWQSAAWALGLIAVVLFVTAPLGDWAQRQSGLPGFEKGYASLANLPGWLLVVAAVTAGVVEETLYRGYAIERLATFTGNYWWAGLLAWVAFGLAHAPFWGWGPVVSISIAGLPLLVYFVVKRDLIACIIAHTVTDLVGLVYLAPVAVQRGSLGGSGA